MLKLFQSVISSMGVGITRQPEFEYLKASYLRELAKIEDYYHNRVYSVKNQHFLVRLLNNLNVPMEYGVDQYSRVVDARAPSVVRLMGITSEESRGVVHPGIFYGPGSVEILISDTDYFDPFFAEQHWKEICAVKPLWHPKSDLGLMLPNGRPSTTGEGLSVISINLPLLAIQYRSFCLDQMTKDLETDSLLGAAHFVHMYVLPNMIYAQTDIVIINRIMNLFYGAPMGVALKRHPFMVHDYGSKIDSVLYKVIKNIEHKDMHYSWILKSIPVISTDDAQSAMIMPDLAPMMQVEWAIVVARLPIIQFLVDIGGDSSKRMDNDLRNKLTQMIKTVMSSHVCETTLPKDMLYDTYNTMEDLIKK